MPNASLSKASLAGGTLPANARQPAPGKPRFVRNKGGDDADPTPAGTVRLTLETDADFCQQLLIDGYVQSYVDFYHLTHRADPSGHKKLKVMMGFDEMMTLKDNLLDCIVGQQTIIQRT